MVAEAEGEPDATAADDEPFDVLVAFDARGDPDHAEPGLDTGNRLQDATHASQDDDVSAVDELADVRAPAGTVGDTPSGPTPARGYPAAADPGCAQTIGSGPAGSRTTPSCGLVLALGSLFWALRRRAPARPA